jgi:hypothetical protein
VKNGSQKTKKELILEIAGALEAKKFTPAEFEQIRRQLINRLGEAGKTGYDHIAGVLAAEGYRVVWSESSDTQGKYEEEFEDLLHFSTLEEAEMCLIRLDELRRKFLVESETAAAERVLEVARLGKRRAEMIAHNRKVELHKREEKQEIAQWFRIWLETPEVFFDWLEVRKQSPEYVSKFGAARE